MIDTVPATTSVGAGMFTALGSDGSEALAQSGERAHFFVLSEIFI